MRSVLWATLAVAFAMASHAEARPITWNLEGALLDDGTAASGSFVYDADINRYTNWLISTEDGLLSAFTYGVATSEIHNFYDPFPSVFKSAEHVLFRKHGGDRYMYLSFTSPLTNSRGTVPLDLFVGTIGGGGSWECMNCTPTRAFVAGAVTSVPEPSTVVVLTLGLGAALTWRFASRNGRRLRSLNASTNHSRSATT